MDNKLAFHILIALIVGLTFGAIVHIFAAPNGFWQAVVITNTFGSGGALFVSLIKLIVIPLVFISIVNAVCTLENISQFGRIGVATFSLYLVNTITAIVAAMFFASLVQPGLGADLGLADPSVKLSLKEPPSLLAMIVNIVPVNPFEALAQGNILQVLFMAVITGVAIKKLENPDTVSASRAFAVANNVVMKLVSMVMSLAPWGVFFLSAKLAATLDMGSIFSVMTYVGTVLLVILFWIFVVYPLVVFATTGRNPLNFIRQIQEQMIFALSTGSSNATIPVTLRTLTEKLHASSRIAGFSVPLGATMNMSGAAIYMVVASMFVADAYGIHLNRAEMIDLGFSSLLLAIATGGIPGGAIVTISVLLHSLGLPMEAMGIIVAVDRIIDPFSTVVNVTGDTVVCTIVSHRSSL